MESGQVEVQQVMVVSIRTRPEGRVNRPAEHGTWTALAVSIRTRPEGRVNPSDTCSAAGSAACFNPHPARGPGESILDEYAFHSDQKVSIRTRPEGRVNLPLIQPGARHTWFQSAPGPRAG